MRMDSIIVVEGILLRGHTTKSGYLLTIITCLVIGGFSYIWQSGKISRYIEKEHHMTKRIDVVVKKETVQLKWHHYRYVFTFSGLDEYEGIVFYNRSALVEQLHTEGEKVSLLINEHNLEEFWFEEEDEPDKGVLILSIMVFFWRWWSWY